MWIKTLLYGGDVKTEDTTKGDEVVITGSSSQTSDILNLNKVLKKDFKIRGTIGLQKDKLTFSSLAYQMNNGQKKMYTDVEICEEVIRAISPDLPLRYFLEGKNDLTLQKLRKILRAHFQEKDPTTLFNSLSNSFQQNNESALDFVIGLMNMRQKVLFVSEEMDTRFQYSEPFVQTHFLHSVVTGLRNDNIRNEIKPLLKDNMSDEELLEHLNKAVSDEKERQSKMKKFVNLNNSTSKGENIDKEKKENPILTELRELKVQLTAMKSDIDDLKKTNEPKRL